MEGSTSNQVPMTRSNSNNDEVKSSSTIKGEGPGCCSDGSNGDVPKWELRFLRYKGTLIGDFQIEEVVGPIAVGIDTMQQEPDKYLAVKYMTQDFDLPNKEEQNFTFILRKDAFQCAPSDPSPDGPYTLVSMVAKKTTLPIRVSHQNQ